MKKILTSLFLLISISIICQEATATIRRVGFLSSTTPVSGVDYNSFQAAHDASSSGDTIQLYPGAQGASYNGNINKKLVIIGNGYYYNSYNIPVYGIPNIGLQILPGDISNVRFTIGLGSAGTIMEGLSNLTLTTSNIPDSLNNITIQRSRNVTVNFNNSGVCNNWIIVQSVNVSVSQGGYDPTFSGNRTISNLRIENSLGVIVAYTGSTGQSPVGLNSGLILNCIFGWNGVTGTDISAFGRINLNNSVFVIQNCIDAADPMGGNLSNYGLFGGSNTIFINNITVAASNNNIVFTNPGCSGNVFGITYTGNSVFAGYPNNTSGNQTLNSPDATWILSANSIAKGAGLIPGTNTPTDCGIYGGLNPYKSSGIPPVPSFYKLTSASSQATSSPYTVTFSVKSNN